MVYSNRCSLSKGLISKPDYNIERTAELTLEAHTAGRLRTAGRMLTVVAGEGYIQHTPAAIPPPRFPLAA